VELYNKYKGKVDFILVDLDGSRSAAQKELIDKFYKGWIPWVTILDKNHKAVYNDSGETSVEEVSRILDKVLENADKSATYLEKD